LIYFIQAATSGGPIKIGVTIDLKRRLKQIEKQTGWKLFVLGVMDGSYTEERILHHKFATDYIESEWFNESTEIREFIDAECMPWDESATETKREIWAVRLEFDSADHERLERVAKLLKLSKAGFARMAVMDRVREEEARVKE
jgi:hypothetical protein